MFCESEATLSTSIPVFLNVHFAIVSMQSVVSACREK
ncbi:hypothetical protein HNQ57_002672 [Zhongshania antarctica]|uniref:Uncharacterized protein n=1 Tax=Zhongshania antarctica TaxID=641702 RepID=A0A840R7N8_9GAMM|nr:hypothetical protein [Zhongshania antarctica]